MSAAVWQQMFDSCSTLDRWNEYVVPAMKTEGEAFKLAAASEAKRRGYRADKEAGVYKPPLDWRITKGRNLIYVAWDGQLWAKYSSGDKAYCYPTMTHEDFEHLVNSIYPDRLMAGYRKREEKKAEAQKAPAG